MEMKCSLYHFKNTKKPVYSYSANPDRRFSSSTSQHFKMFPPFASSEGYSASGVRYQSDGVRDTHPLPHSESTRIRERMCDLTLTISHSPFAYYSYISSFQEYGKPVYSYSTNPDRRFSSSTSQHFKMSPPFASSEGVSASGDRLQSDGVQDTHLLPHSLSTRIRERMCDFALTHSHSPFAYIAYFPSYSLLIILSEVL